MIEKRVLIEVDVLNAVVGEVEVEETDELFGYVVVVDAW